jgi:hypothetical protein
MLIINTRPSGGGGEWNTVGRLQSWPEYLMDAGLRDHSQGTNLCHPIFMCSRAKWCEHQQYTVVTTSGNVAHNDLEAAGLPHLGGSMQVAGAKPRRGWNAQVTIGHEEKQSNKPTEPCILTTFEEAADSSAG